MKRINKTLDQFTNKKRLMTINKYLSNYFVFSGIYIVFGFVMYGLLNNLIIYLSDKDFPKNDFNLSLKYFFFYDEANKAFYYLLLGLLIFGYIKTLIKLKTAFGSFNVGQKGTSRITERKELEEQYKSIPDRGKRFSGKGGFPVAREENKLYIDDTPVNNLTIGISRSGKGEMIVFPLIDIYSRAEKQASMIIADPKLELAQSSIPRLTDLGYECHILNLVDPEYSMGYNPLSLIVEEYKNGDIAAAEQLCRALCYSIYSASELSSDPFWNDNATALLTALILASCEDNINADIKLNERRYSKYLKREKNKKEKAINKLSKEDRKIYLIQNYYEKIKKASYENHLNLKTKDIIIEISEVLGEESYQFIKEAINSKKIEIDYKEDKFEYIYENEKKINLYSIITTFTLLANKKINKDTTELDEYFNKRGENNKARILYASTGISGDKTKGSIYSTMLTGLNVFAQTNIAKMTAKSTFNIEKIGFGGKPIAIFIGIPDYDSSNHFIASVFIRQLYYTLSKLATASKTGKCLREVIFILDEFGNLPAIEQMEKIITVCLGRNIKFNLIIQAYSQLDTVYGKEKAKTIAGNCGNHCYILTNDLDTAKEFAERIGSETIVDITRQGAKYSLNKTITESQNQDFLLDHEELRLLMPGEMIVSRVMKRETLNGTPVRPRVIFNLGKYRMLYRHQYLMDYFPSGQQLYESPNIKRVNRLIKEAEFELKNEIKNGAYNLEEEEKKCG